MNIYSDSSQTALKYLKNTKANINNVLIMTGDFNIRNSTQNPLFPHHLVYNDTLMNIADSLSTCLSKSTNQVSTRYSDNPNNLNLVIDLMFLHPNSEEFDNHTIYPKQSMLLDHALLTVNILIFEEHIQTRKQRIIKNSKEEIRFIAEIIESIKRLNIDHIESKEDLESIVQEFAHNIDEIWFKYSKMVNIIQNYGGMKNVRKNQRSTDFQDVWRIGKASRVWLRRPTGNFLMSKSKKLEVRVADHENS